MAALFPAPFSVYFDSNGDPLSGGLVYTYTAGTTTPLATYTDSTGNTANANPVVLDAAGRADIWYDGSKLYKIVLKTSAGVTVKTVDNVGLSSSGFSFTQSGVGAVATTAQDEFRSKYRPEQFGCVGDGTTDDTANLQAAINAADTADAILELTHGAIYKFTQLTLKGSIKGAGGSNSNSTLKYSGTTTPAIKTDSVLADQSIGGFTLDMSAASTTVDCIDLKYGASTNAFFDIYLKVNSNVRHGFILRGLNPDDSTANGAQFRNKFDRIISSTVDTKASGNAIYFYSGAITDSYTNANVITHSQFAAGFTTHVFNSGDGNVLAYSELNGVGCTALEVATGSSDMWVAGNYFDADLTTKVSITDTNAAARNLVTFVENKGVGSANISDSVVTSGQKRYALINANERCFQDIDFDLVTAVGTNQLRPGAAGGILAISGDNRSPNIAGRLLLASETYAGGLNAVSNSGGASLSIRDNPSAQFRVVKTSDASTFTILFTMDYSGNLIPVAGAKIDLATNGAYITRKRDNVAAASEITPGNLEIVRITGSGDVNTITATGYDGRVVTFYTEAGTPTLKDGTGNLKLAGDFAMGADDVITLFCDGTSWFEMSRSAN